MTPALRHIAREVLGLVSIIGLIWTVCAWAPVLANLMKGMNL